MGWWSYVFKAIQVAGLALTGYEISEIFNANEDAQAALALAQKLGEEVVRRNQNIMEQNEAMHQIQITVVGMAILLIATVFIGIIALICQFVKRCFANVVRESIEETIEDA